MCMTCAEKRKQGHGCGGRAVLKVCAVSEWTLEAPRTIARLIFCQPLQALFDGGLCAGGSPVCLKQFLLGFNRTATQRVFQIKLL